METQKEVEIKPQRVKWGRPRSINVDIDKKEYQKLYYETNKEKTKGDNLCEHCHLLYSKSNKTRHMKKYHPEVIDEKTKNKFLNELAKEERKAKLIFWDEILDIFKKDIAIEETLREMEKIKKMKFKTKEEKDEFVRNLIKTKENLPDDIENSDAFLQLSDFDKKKHKYWYGQIPSHN